MSLKYGEVWQSVTGNILMALGTESASEFKDVEWCEDMILLLRTTYGPAEDVIRSIDHKAFDPNEAASWTRIDE